MGSFEIGGFSIVLVCVRLFHYIKFELNRIKLEALANHTLQQIHHWCVFALANTRGRPQNSEC